MIGWWSVGGRRSICRFRLHGGLLFLLLHHGLWCIVRCPPRLEKRRIEPQHPTSEQIGDEEEDETTGMLTGTLVEVAQDGAVEEPVLHATFDVLKATGTDVENINGTDAPRMVVSIAPIVKTILPIGMSVIPPLTCDIMVLQGEVGHDVMVTAIASLSKYIVRAESIVENGA